MTELRHDHASMGHSTGCPACEQAHAEALASYARLADFREWLAPRVKALHGRRGEYKITMVEGATDPDTVRGLVYSGTFGIANGAEGHVVTHIPTGYAAYVEDTARQAREWIAIVLALSTAADWQFQDASKLPNRLTAIAITARNWANNQRVPPDSLWRTP